MVMKILTADDWPPLMQETYYATDNSILTLLYFVIVVVLGLYIIMTLFIAILLERFAGQDEAKYVLEDLTEKVRHLHGRELADLGSGGFPRVCQF